MGRCLTAMPFMERWLFSGIDGIGRRSSVQESIMLSEIRRSGLWIDEDWIVGLLAASECREASEIVG